MRKKEEKRILPADEGLLDEKKYDYSIYALFQAKSYVQDGVRFVYKNFTYEELHEEYNKTRLEKDPAYQCMSRATFARRIKDLKMKQMITEGKIKDLHGKTVSVYFLPEDYKIKKLIPLETIRFLSNFTNSNVIKTYVYLLDKNGFAAGENRYYSFTKSEVCRAIGLSDTNSNGPIIMDILNGLSLIGLITFVEYWDKTSMGQPTPRLRLVSTKLYIEKQTL